MSTLSRRQLLRAGSTAGALLVVRPRDALARPVGPRDAHGTPRASRLFPGTWVVHGDLHNHSLLSDGAGPPDEAFVSMREAGLDVAALTDHSTVGTVVPGPFAGTGAPCFGDEGCQAVAGLDADAWRRTGELADRADEAGAFTAIRGFEWSSPTLGHMNVWFSEEWTDPLATGGLTSAEDLLRFAEQEGLDLAPGALETLADLLAQSPAGGLGMAGWYDWLKAAPSRPVVGGGADALAGFNHPGREPLRFSDFHHDPDLLQRVVSLELFNRRDDYLFRAVNGRSPLVACLDAGWQPGLLGVTDEHGSDWGFPDGKGRSGFWVEELSRDGVRAAMLERRFFATVLRGLRLDAAANGVRMGGELAHDRGTVTLEIDVDRGPAWVGKELIAQVLTTGAPLPTVLAAESVRVPAASEPLPRVVVEVDAEEVPWLVLRLADPERPAPEEAPEPFRGAGAAVAYASPWFLRPDADAPAPGGAGSAGAGGGAPTPQSSPEPIGAPPAVAATGPPAEGTGPRGSPSPGPRRPRPDTPAGRVASAAGVPDRGSLPATGGGTSGAGALLLGAAAGLLALRRRERPPDGPPDGPAGE